MAFEFRYTFSGAAPIAQPFVVLDAQTLIKGQLLLLNVATGEVTGATTADTTLAGVAAADVDNTDDGESVKVILAGKPCLAYLMPMRGSPGQNWISERAA